ncbi:hypothetical protein CCHR01_06590 [Colletotrichum chrysophilum]|uniref:DUF6590 domain-containing protein n=1 Tax=Colletotrichum chrysophilum TaxID=1836956 RepID=A0AAD9AND9_9PEZI|nr:hypothetical protein CCHR01_06590 [Colletotrichum chrysophilum]
MKFATMPCASIEKPGGVFEVDLHPPWKYQCCALSVPPGRKNEGEKMHAPIQGPVLIRRFVVVREGKWGCLCLEIHTHAGRGAGGEDDQHLYAIIHSVSASAIKSILTPRLNKLALFSSVFDYLPN